MASADLIIDIIVIMLPMPILWTLQLKTSKKVLLTAIFGLGFMYENFRAYCKYSVMRLTTKSIIAITCVRIKYMLELDPTDITYTFAPLALIAAIVPLLGIINASLPTMRPALERIFGPRWRFGSSGGSSGRRRWYKYNSREPRHQSGTEENNNERRDSETEFPLVTIGGTLTLLLLQQVESTLMLTSRTMQVLSIPSKPKPDQVGYRSQEIGKLARLTPSRREANRQMGSCR